MKKHTLQLEIMGIVGAVLITACLLLTVNSLFLANNYYGDYEEWVKERSVVDDPSIMKEDIPSELTYQEVSIKFSLQSIIAMIVIIVLGLAGTYWAVGRRLRPLEELTRSVHETDDKNLDKRVELSGAKGEVQILADAFNGMMERLENAFLIQKSFAANAAHELKTPLAVIKSSLQVLEMTPNPETTDYQEFMQDTDQSLDRIIKTVEGLLALANMTDIETDQCVDVYALLNQATQELKQKAKDRQVKLELVKENEAFAYGNPGLLYRAFYNLIENAVKYNRLDGQVTVTLGSSDEYVTVRVEDNGIGIGEEDLSHIFEPFYRADKSRSQRIPGSGLGLAVVSMILEKHAGKIKVTSEISKGSTFKIGLPTVSGLENQI